VTIENIEAMRRLQGIEDVELRKEIRGLRAGDHVKLTFLTGTAAEGETLIVRITSIKGSAFRGKLAGTPSRAARSRLPAGSPVCFTRNHIHSLPKGQPKHGR
jgi:hypothetical protein